MIYSYSPNTAASVTQGSPTRTPLPVNRGVVIQLTIGFPPGCTGLLHLQIYWGQTQLWPSNPDEDFAWDGFVFNYPEHYEIDAEPYEFTALTWNDDDTYAHDILIQFDIIRQEDLAQESGDIGLIQGLKRRLLGGG